MKLKTNKSFTKKEPRIKIKNQKNKNQIEKKINI
jgi:hypothetical protein